MDLKDFFYKYYINPIYADEGYNFINTLTYSIIAFLLLLLIFKLLKKFHVKIDKFFLYSLLPFIAIGSLIRALVDAKIFNISFWTVSPGIYLLIAGFYFLVFFLGLFFERMKKLNYWKFCFTIGVGAFFPILLLSFNKIKISNVAFGCLILSLTFLFSCILLLCFKKLNFKSGQKYFWPFFAHLFDASTTFVAVDFLNAFEKHPLPNFFINLTGTAGIMYILKLAVLIPFVYFLDKEVKNNDLKNFIVIAITVLGLAEGFRDLLAILISF
ncbi:MAG: DUF63 family protein [Candidatus Nanoarchaeia archaeon]